MSERAGMEEPKLGMTDPCYVLVWADTDLHLRVVGVFATRQQAEDAAAAEHGVALEWV